jgi:hypothetical protein
MRKMAAIKHLLMILIIVAIALYLGGMFNLAHRSEADAWDMPPKPRPPVYFDLYTQRGGEGSNAFAGTFKPDEEVLLIVGITEEGLPVENQSILFEVIGPPNPQHNISALVRAVTNSSGIGSATLTIPSASEQPTQTIVGTWIVHSQIGLDQNTVGDTMHFEVVLIAPEFPISATALLVLVFATVTIVAFKKRNND